MAIDASLMAAINAAKAEMQAALTQEEAGDIMEATMTRLSNNAEYAGWDGNDLSYAYGNLQQVYNLWQSPMIVDNAKDQTIVFQPGGLPPQNSNQVMVAESQDPSFFQQGTTGIDVSSPGVIKNTFAALQAERQRKAFPGRMVVAAGFALAGTGLALMLWRIFFGGARSRAW